MDNCLSKTELHKNLTTETDAETLARRLDEDLDKFIDNLKQTPYKDGWNEATWREEMEQHPFFTSKPLNPEDVPSPLIEGLQNLRYDPNDNTNEELANNHKVDGNFNFKCRKYQLAILCYKEGLKLDFSNDQLRAQMLNNLSASHFFLKNYRSSLIAAEEAIKFKPDYSKTILRAIQCCRELKEFDKCCELCDKYMIQIPGDNTVSRIKKEAIQSKKIMEKEKRKLAKYQKQREIEQQQLLDELNKRKLYIIGQNSGPIKDLAILDPKLPGSIKGVHLHEGHLVWPVAILYPEYNVSDFILEFDESSTFYNHLSEMFSEKPVWDVEGKYSVDTVNVYCEFLNEHKKATKVTKIDIQKCTLFEALTELRCPIENGIPAFTVYFAGGEHEKKFLEEVPCY